MSSGGGAGSTGRGGRGAAGRGGGKSVGKPTGLTQKGKRLSKSGALTPSPDRLLRTRVNWMGVDLPTTKGEYGVRTLPAKFLAQAEYAHKSAVPGRPLLIHFYTDSRDDEVALDYAEELWNDDRIGLSSRLFNCYRLSLDDMSPHDRKKYGGKTPSIVLLSSEGKTIATIKGWKANAGSLFKKLSSAVRKQWGANLARLLPKHADILRDLDEIHGKLEKAKRTLASTKEHVKVHDCAPGRKRLKRTAKEIEDLTKRREKTLAQESKLYGFAAPAKAEKKAKEKQGDSVGSSGDNDLP